jgi:hypothetical protein
MSVQEPKTMSARLRGVVAAVAAVGALAALSVLAGAGWATGSSSSATQYQYGGKVTICHHTHSKKNPWVTISVSQSAWMHHFSKTQDTIGTCASAHKGAAKDKGDTHHGNKGKHDETSDDTSTTSTTSTTSPGHGHGHGNGNGRGPDH